MKVSASSSLIPVGTRQESPGPGVPISDIRGRARSARVNAMYGLERLPDAACFPNVLGSVLGAGRVLALGERDGRPTRR